jgi:hypothetical protein
MEGQKPTPLHRGESEAPRAANKKEKDAPPEKAKVDETSKGKKGRE